ncbi:DUF916 and DUF3324 domain-containing protein [Enterococcus hulanensis]|uniref:DUF916 and DUF3324 domain-containing protein n=1 Tax=Enterococcus hulanensis TaxID=2559929 RepID=UPI00288E450A|nr:DUF916 and DUF3324 domain-containing protein [Enterococcus hulanensis]MDT2659195.1 DUF916 and DUF3324 domain-containing protein [Enterococcus hulanensis]
MMTWEKGKKASLMILFLWMCFFFPIAGQAEEEAQNPAGFTVESVIPDNQVDNTKTYYYLKLNPEQKQTIQVKVISTQEEPVTVMMNVHDAVSSSVGAIDYANANPKLDKSLTNPITKLVKIKDNQKKVTVQNFEEKIVEYEISAPKEAFPGVKLGSLRFVRQSEKKEQNKNGLSPEYARVIALMLTEDESTFNKGAELHLIEKVRLDLSDGRKVIAATIQNDQPKVAQELTIKGNVVKKGEKKVIAKREMKNFSVAPNSNFDFEILLGLDRFSAGTYIFTGEAKGAEKTWKWKKEFTVGNKQANKVNEETVYRIHVPKWVLWAGIGLTVSLIGLIAYLVYRQRQWHERKG